MKRFALWIGKLFVTLVLVFVVMPVLLIACLGALPALLGEGAPDSEKLVAVVELNGMITDSKEVVRELYRQAKSEKTKAIVLRVDSPGGAVGPSQEIYSAISKLRKTKPIVASFGTVAASGGLYSALSANRIYAQPGTLTGSIGVILQIPNFQKITEKVGFNMVTIKSGALKDAGNSFREMTESEKKYFQSTIDSAHQGFMDAIVEGRGLKREDVVKFADGRIILGSDAVKLNLIDGIGDLDDAARSALELAAVPLKAGEMPDLYYPMDKFEAFKGIMGAASRLSQLLSQGSIELNYLMY